MVSKHIANVVGIWLRTLTTTTVVGLLLVHAGIDLILPSVVVATSNRRASAAEPSVVKPGSQTTNEDVQESDDLVSKSSSKKPLLVQMAEDHGYRLAEGEDVKRIPPPFDPIRAKYYHSEHGAQAAAINNPPDVMIFGWSDRDSRLKNRSMTFGGQNLMGVLEYVAGINSQTIIGPEATLQERITGDWVVRVGTKDFQIVRQLNTLLREELQVPIRLELREVERPVFVLRGSFEFKPLDEEAKGNGSPTIQIFGKALVPNSGAGGGSGDFPKLLDSLGRWIAMPVVSEVENPPKGQFNWRLHGRSPWTKQTQAEDHDPKLVMENVAAQTGLTFTEANRPVRILFVERDEPNE